MHSVSEQILVKNPRGHRQLLDYIIIFVQKLYKPQVRPCTSTIELDSFNYHLQENTLQTQHN